MIALGGGVPCLWLDQVDSTNDEARRRAMNGAQGPLWICARVQEKGRGRRGRQWVSKDGNLFASLLYRPVRPLSQRAQLSFVAALALHDALTHVFESLSGRLFCKWPNDLLLDGAKLAGILLESEQDWVVMGLGVNLLHAPDDSERPAISLQKATGLAIDRLDMLKALSRSTQIRVAQWEEEGFAPIREDWLARATGLGSDIVVRLEENELRGRFCGLADDGALLLRPRSLGLEGQAADPHEGMIRITAGDVFPALKGA
ncbi:biotin--[acetyl-CoA-carboxylase] ligase [Iodidimonas nitroreducens]|uniref:Biotin--[acetyl-CoA-carboxylase] ligase n=1 Tax=Iodidimonas nitroreducens TaxID=1236968 RepID=A0A5A7N7M4_9PROT|nr:biotin--[acetyl-CoA-carboxylase] ligase [Iodidimonas nitroreducens]GAK32915.1 biotin--[acetyl-CoA-carboxylase] synthetase [alpha proteobacterium Q-1]GER03079.1 biotin--[acetyl-CoA-carboxylase] ligase [Iodidimonas nitroreducens]